MQTLKQIESFVLTKWTIVKTIFSILQLETKLASLSVVPFILNLGLLMIVFMTSWFLISLGVGYGFFLYSHNMPLSFLGAFLFNLLVMFALMGYLKYNLKNLSFVKTRSLLSQQKRPSNEPIKKKISQTD